MWQPTDRRWSANATTVLARKEAAWPNIIHRAATGGLGLSSKRTRLLVKDICVESRGCIRAASSPEGTSAMSKDAEFAAKEHSSSMMEDFGRFSPVETLDSDGDITDEFFDAAYAEENAGA